MSVKPRPFALIILDGWGYREEKKDNAIACARKPHWDQLWKHYPHTLLTGSGHSVGLPCDQMGNSEVGHLTIGAGRVIPQDLTRIDEDIEKETFFQNAALNQVMDHAKKTHTAVHVLGLLSNGGVHSHERHLQALATLASQKGVEHLYFHAFLDGRDTPPKSAEQPLKNLMAHCKSIGTGKIVSLIGRYYAMDRDHRWDRIEKAYTLLTCGKGEYEANDALTALHLAYERGETDEFVKPTTVHAPHETPVTLQEGDSLIFMNFRADRARELCHALLDTDFNHFPRPNPPTLSHFVTLTEYDRTLPVQIAYPPLSLTNLLADYLSHLNLRQLRIAETEKYAHVTFFFNGGREIPFPLEDRVLIPSPKVATYDLKPEMSAPLVTERLVTEIKNQHYDVIICNFANPDMVGHTGQFDATVKAIETIDTCIGKIVEALLSVGGEALITADHGNAEIMFDAKTHQPHTAHTHELVPLLYIGRPALPHHQKGTLADIAPTLLYLMQLPIPPEMTGHPLFQLKQE